MGRRGVGAAGFVLAAVLVVLASATPLHAQDAGGEGDLSGTAWVWRTEAWKDIDGETRAPGEALLVCPGGRAVLAVGTLLRTRAGLSLADRGDLDLLAGPCRTEGDGWRCELAPQRGSGRAQSVVLRRKGARKLAVGRREFLAERDFDPAGLGALGCPMDGAPPAPRAKAGRGAAAVDASGAGVAAAVAGGAVAADRTPSAASAAAAPRACDEQGGVAAGRTSLHDLVARFGTPQALRLAPGASDGAALLAEFAGAPWLGASATLGVVIPRGGARVESGAFRLAGGTGPDRGAVVAALGRPARIERRGGLAEDRGALGCDDPAGEIEAWIYPATCTEVRFDGARAVAVRVEAALGTGTPPAACPGR